jgi:two-component system chemotaxis sensor kinase CheA
VAISTLGTVLGHESSDEGPVVVVSADGRRHALRVDALLGQRPVVNKELSRIIPRIDVLAGASVEPDGSITLVLDVQGLIRRAAASAAHRVQPLSEPEPGRVAPPVRGAHVLVVDDALTVRELQRSILVRAGYSVQTASSGEEALVHLAQEPADLVLTDYEMPGMDGFALTAAIRAQPRLASLPVIVMTSRADDESRRRGLEAGADAYFVKRAFDERLLLDAVERLLGEAA